MSAASPYLSGGDIDLERSDIRDWEPAPPPGDLDLDLLPACGTDPGSSVVDMERRERAAPGPEPGPPAPNAGNCRPSKLSPRPSVHNENKDARTHFSTFKQRLLKLVT